MSKMMTSEAPAAAIPAAMESESVASTRGALAGLALAMLLSSLGTSIANVALPTLAEVLGATFQQIQWVVLAYLLAVTSLIVGVGRLGDLVGRRRLFLAGIVLFTTASAWSGAVSTLGWLVMARALQGLGAAAMMALSMAFVGEIVPKTRTGRAMGLLGTTSAIGTALGPSLGGLLIAQVGWRAIFLSNVPLGIFAFLLARRHLPADARPAPTGRASFDGLGTLLMAFALATYALAMTSARGGRFGSLNLVLLTIAGGLVGAFAWIEARVRFPLIRLAVFREAHLRTGFITTGLVSTVLMTTLTVGPFYLSRGLGLGAGTVGVVLSIGPLVAAVMGLPAGQMVDRLGAGRVGGIGLAAIATGTLTLALFGAPGVTHYVVPIVTITFGYALFQTANNTAVLRDVPSDQRGVISGMLNLSRNLGLITGTSVMGAVFAFAAKTRDVATAAPEAVAVGMRVTFGVAAVLIGIAPSLAAGARPGNSEARKP